MDWKQVLRGGAIIFSLLLIIYWIENAVIGIGIAIVLLIAWIIIPKWRIFIQAMRTVESQIWGKPLDEHSKKELKEKKIYLRLTKKKRISIEFIIMLVVVILLLLIALLFNLVR
jgi:predicted RND superfamily exporter protein